MNDLIKVSYENERPTVMGRDLHEALGIRIAYKNWFSLMCEHGFAEGSDFCSILGESVCERSGMDHQMTVEMAKEICTIQHTDISKKYREYFLELEQRLNSPEAIMARALQFANQQLSMIREQNTRLLETNAIQAKQIVKMQPKTSYYDICLACKDLLSITTIAKDYGWSGRKMNKWLKEQCVQFKQGNIWLLYQKYAQRGYTSTKTHVHTGKDGNPHTTVHTYWTQKGRLFIYQIMKADGHLPVMENDG